MWSFGCFPRLQDTAERGAKKRKPEDARLLVGGLWLGDPSGLATFRGIRPGSARSEGDASGRVLGQDSAPFHPAAAMSIHFRRVQFAQLLVRSHW